jgi:hypothetical protein
MSRHFLCPFTYRVVTPTDPDLYIKVNPGMLEVKKVRGGWKPLDKKKWFGYTPIKDTNNATF